MTTNEEDSDGLYQSPSHQTVSVLSRIGYSSTPNVSRSPSKKRSKHSGHHTSATYRSSLNNSSLNGSSDSSLLGYNNSPATTPQGRDNKAGWYDIHNKHSSLANKSRTSLILCGDSIIAGLSRYPKIWDQYFRPFKALNFGIGGDRTQHVLWRAENIDLPATTEIVVLHCGTNNIDRDPPRDIANGIASVGLAFQEKRPGVKIIMTGLLPRDADWTFRRDKIMKTNRCMKLLCKEKLTDFYYMKQDSDWTLDEGKLNERLFYSDCLHLIETGNDKFAKSIVTMVYKVKENTSIVYSSDESENDSQTSFVFERKHSEKRRHKGRNSSPDYHSSSRKRRRSNSDESSPRKSSYHHSPFKWEKNEKHRFDDSTPNKWSSARKWSKVIKEEHHDKYSHLDRNSINHHSRYTYGKDDNSSRTDDSLNSTAESVEESTPEGTAKSIDISLDERKRLEARRAKFGIVAPDTDKDLNRLSALSKAHVLDSSNTAKARFSNTAAPSALVSRIRKSVEQARQELTSKKQRRPSLVTYSSPSSQDDSQEEMLPYDVDIKKFFSDYGGGSDTE